MVGISSVWYAWIEQGREVQASPLVLGRLASALKLSAEERAFLFELSGRPDPQQMAFAARAAPPASLVAVVEAMDLPTYALDPLWNVCCWNAEAGQLLGAHEGRERNLLRFIFLDPSVRSVMPYWRGWARRLLEAFRAASRHRMKDPAVRALIDTLRFESELFARFWDGSWAGHTDRGIWIFDHAERGPQSYLRNSFSPSDHPDYTLVVHTPVMSIAAPNPPPKDPHKSGKISTVRRKALSSRI